MRLLREIEGLADWPKPVNPDRQWVPGRSAMELARTFCRNGSPQVPDALREMFRSTPGFTDVEFQEGVPELTTSLPPFHASGPRHHDLWLRATAGGKPIGIGVEGKVDEPFDQQLYAKYKLALKDRAAGKSTDRPERYEAVTSLVLRRAVTPAELETSVLRYQLLSGVAGTLIQAAIERRPIAVFLVYELVTNLSDRSKHEQNEVDLDLFIETLQATKTTTNGLFGPISYPATPLLPMPVELWIGRVSEDVTLEVDSPSENAPDTNACTREDFLATCATSIAATLGISANVIDRRPNRIKVQLPNPPRSFLRVEATNSRPWRVEVALKAGSKQVGRWLVPRGSVIQGIPFDQRTDGGYTCSGFSWQRESADFNGEQDRAIECIRFLAEWSKSIR